MVVPKQQSTILLAEPDTMFRRVLARALTLEGYDIIQTSTFEQLRHRLESENIELIITDVLLPHTDGVMLLRWMRQNFPDTPIIVLTRSGTVATAIEAVKLGVADYLLKPLSTETIVSSIRRILRETTDRRTREKLAATVMSAISHAEIATYFDKNVPVVAAPIKEVLHVAPLTLDISARLLYSDPNPDVVPVSLSYREAALLEELMHHPNAIVPFESLASVMGAVQPSTASPNIQKAVRPCVSRLRKKIQTLVNYPVILTIRRTGYLYRSITPQKAA